MENNKYPFADEWKDIKMTMQPSNEDMFSDNEKTCNEKDIAITMLGKLLIENKDKFSEDEYALMCAFLASERIKNMQALKALRGLQNAGDELYKALIEAKNK